MMVRFLGAVLILVGCGGFGMMICISYKREEEMLRQLICALNMLQCELQFRMTPLPELCLQASSATRGKISRYFQILSAELNRQEAADVSSCCDAAKEILGSLPEKIIRALEVFSLSLGQFDVHGQLHGLEETRKHCAADLERMMENREMRLRSYQTLGICGGAALVILLV